MTANIRPKNGHNSSPRGSPMARIWHAPCYHTPKGFFKPRGGSEKCKNIIYSYIFIYPLSVGIERHFSTLAQSEELSTMSPDRLHPSDARQNGSNPTRMRSHGVRQNQADSILSDLTYLPSSARLIPAHRQPASICIYSSPSQLIIILIPAHPQSSSSSAQLINLLTYRLKCYLMVFHAPLAHSRISAG